MKQIFKKVITKKQVGILPAHNVFEVQTEGAPQNLKDKTKQTTTSTSKSDSDDSATLVSGPEEEEGKSSAQN